MQTNKSNPYFHFTRSQRPGVVCLLLLIVIFQLLYFYADFSKTTAPSPQETQWLSLQTTIDSLKKQQLQYVPKVYPFNPNFITDFKGYKLGMSTQEIDRLLLFRKGNQYVNSAKEFQLVTKISDSLLETMAPYFKFPDWVKNKKSYHYNDYSKSERSIEKITVKDINQATQEDLIKIYGIGPALSERILKEKEKFGAFVSMNQMQDIWGLSPEVIVNIKKHYTVLHQPSVKKIKINTASLKELMQLPYFKYTLAKEILTYRSMNGKIQNAEDLIKIINFPVDKLPIIALYLEF
ncbi:MAG TPA: helix-hairpin-helix domain-containing protein [Flavobacterium sp.]|jgi:DNA uptake protein ComE-like DNA-binding protein